MKKLGFGTMRLPLINPEDKTSIDQNYFNQLADKFIEKGFNYFDTAYTYHDEKSEGAIKKALTERCLPIRKHRGAREKRYSFGYAVFLILALMK